MKQHKKILILVACTIILANIPPFQQIFKFFLDQRHYRYSNYNGSLTFTEFMSRRFDMLKLRHEGCKLARPDLKDKNIYRLFTKNPLAFWRWRLYFVDERYKLPYKNWEDIKKVREKEDIVEIKGCPIEF